MRRYLLLGVSTLAAVLVAYVIGSAGSATHPKPAASKPTQAPQQTATTATQTPRMTETTTAVVTASQTDCRWRLYPDGAIGADPHCAPGLLNPAAAAHPKVTICARSWLAAAQRSAPSAQHDNDQLDKLLIEYQLPGSPLTYTIAHVVPIEDGGSPISPLNLYPLPIEGYGGAETQAIIADQLHQQICAGKTPVQRAAQLLEGDWLSQGLPDDD
jgi:hypothetical protein